jgi:hypothetical protein
MRRTRGHVRFGFRRRIVDAADLCHGIIDHRSPIPAAAGQGFREGRRFERPIAPNHCFVVNCIFVYIFVFL